VNRIIYFFISFFIFQFSFASSQGIERAWMSYSNPGIMNSNFEKHFSRLPRVAEVKDPHRFWSSDYWPRNRGGINYRWNSSTPRGFNYSSPTRSRALTMTQSQLRALAPSEKWDLFIGRYDYPLKREVASYASPSRPSWEGICDGWSGAALNHDEPTAKVLTNPDGIKIPFGSSDIKALLSWYYARKFADGNSQMGRRCRGGATSSYKCTNDLNAGAFHIVLANKVGLEGRSFIADIERLSQVWNHIPYNYQSTVLYSNLRPRATSAPGTVRLMRIKTIVNYVWLLDKNSWNPVLGTEDQKLKARTYEYYLDMDRNGVIIGGDWISTQRPDFLWLSRRASSFSGMFQQLPELLNDQITSISLDIQ
jgi:hypothetical protein